MARYYQHPREASPERKEARELTARVGKRQARYALKMARHLIKMGCTDILVGETSPRRASITATLRIGDQGFACGALATEKRRGIVPPNQAAT